MDYNKYNNPTTASGIHVTEASPIDDRYLVNTEAEVAALSNVEPFPSVMYDGMIVQFADTRRLFMWIESNYGLMTEGYTYPEWYDDIQGQDYGNKLYNFVLIDKVSKVDMTFTDALDDGIFIPIKDIPYHIVQDFLAATVTFKSSSSSYLEQEYPDSLVASVEGLTIILDPKPTVGESFKITIY